MANRRQFITGIVTASTVTIAGCSSVPTIEDGPEDGPEDVVEQYFTAIQNNNFESANEVVYPENPLYPLEEDDVEDLDSFTFTNFDQVSPRELIEDVSEDNLTEEEIGDRAEVYEQRSEDAIGDFDVDDHAWVLVTYEIEGEEGKSPILTVQDDSNWYVFQ